MDFVIASFLVQVYSQKAVVKIQFYNLSELLQGDHQALLKFRVVVSVLSRLVVEFYKGAEKVIVHEPEVREVVEFGLMALEGAFEEVVQQLVALLVSHWVGPGLGYLGQLYVDRFLFF